MKRSPSYYRRICVFAFIVCWLFAYRTSANAQSVTWQILPFYTDTDWPGSHGSPATTNGNVVALHGQPVRTVQTFSGPLKITYDMQFSSRASSDGNLQLFFVPTGLASNLVHPSLQLAAVYRNSLAGDVLVINSLAANGTATQVWGETPFSLSAQTIYHNEINVSPGGTLTWIIGGLTNTIPGNITVPFAQYQLELQGWQPGGPTWTVSNFAVVPEPNTSTLVIAGFASALVLFRRRGVKKLGIDRRNICLLGLAAFCLSSVAASAQSVTWQILPFPQSDWPGPFGSPATTNGGVITLRGQPVRTLQSFSGPLRITYDVSFDARISSDGALQFFLIPPGTPTNQIIPSMALFMGYRSTGVDGLMIYTNKSGSLSPAMTEIPFTLSAQTTYHVTMDFSANGSVGWIVNNQTNFIPSAVMIPYAQYQLEIQSWQPGGPTWTVSNFAVVPEPSVAMLVAASLAGLLFFRTRKRH